MFNLNALMSLLNARPFTPFRFIMSDGGSVDVVSREMVLPGRTFAIVGIPERTRPETVADRWTTVWFMHVSRTKTLVPGAPPFAAPPADQPGTPSAA